ncbi:MAG: LysR family transcriptional regulator [Planctomycetes bacterium]|nr:LysR family transcriptional regulator [Planctomycetota bacterium]
MIDLHRLAGFHLVATLGGYARAARAAPYPITQPALHQQVKKLEAQVGMQLLERVGKDQMRPTPAGARLHGFVAPFFRDLPAVVKSLATGEFDGELSIEAESLLIRQLLPGWLLALRKRRPAVVVRLTEIATPDVGALRTGRADVLVAHLPEIPDDVASQQIAVLYPFLVVPREGPPRRRAPPLRQLAATPFLAYPPGSRQYALQMQALVGQDALPARIMHLDTADTILGFVEAGLGWSLVPSLDARGPVARQLTAYPLARPRTTFPVVMAWRKDAPENPMLDAMIACAPRPRRSAATGCRSSPADRST